MARRWEYCDLGMTVLSEADERGDWYAWEITYYALPEPRLETIARTGHYTSVVAYLGIQGWELIASPHQHWTKREDGTYGPGNSTWYFKRLIGDD